MPSHDPRFNFTVSTCPQNKNQSVAEDTKKREFFDTLGDIGNVEVLNRFGDGKISSGLRSLSKISDSVRTGDTDSAIIPNSAGYVFETIDINPNAAEKAGQFNPGVLNRATSQAESVIDQVKSGNFSLDKIPGVFSDLQNLGSLVDGVYTESDTTKIEDIALCGASPYAIDLVKSAPKFKFMFIVQVQLAEKYKDVFKDATDTRTEESLAFVVKTSTRPNVTIEHEDINMYNFWTKVPKRTIFEPITMKFYDDIKGKAHRFYSTYLEQISPITRLGGKGKAGQLSMSNLESNSMNSSIKNSKSSASVGALMGKNTSIITEVRLFHIVDYGREMTVYHFHHPKIISMNLDELDMANSGDGSEIELQFVYDALHITPWFGLILDKESITQLSGGDSALYPITPIFDANPGSDYGTDAEVDDYDDEDDDNGFGVPAPGEDEAELVDESTAVTKKATKRGKGKIVNDSYFDAATNKWKKFKGS